MDQATIIRRLMGLRERRAVNQEDLSRALGFADRQTLSAIETGKRAIAPAELASAAQFFGVSVDYFTDPLELAGEGAFSWRESNGDVTGLQQFQEQAGRWIATYRHLGKLRGTTVNSALVRVALTAKSSFEAAESEGEAVGRALGLGEIPADTLATALEDKLDTLVLLADTLPGISGAACQLGPLNTIIINRHESASRRAFDMGHELFHLVTWRDMPPPHLDPGNRITAPRARRIETLADSFAAGLLMPKASIDAYLIGRPVPKAEAELPRWLREGALRFHVSGPAFKWRAVSLGLIPKAVATRVADPALRTTDGTAPPPRFSRKFAEMIGWGIAEGALSIRKAANVTGISIDELAALFDEHGLQAPFDL